MSLRRRILLGFVVIAAVLVVTNVALSGTFRSFLLERVDQQLADVSSRPVFRGDPRGRPGERPQDRPGETVSEYYIAFVDPATGAYTPVSSALDTGATPPPRIDAEAVARHTASNAEDARPFTAQSQSGTGRWRLIVVESGPGNRTAVVGISLNELQATLRRVRFVQAAGTLAVLLALGIVSWWMLRLGVHPLEDMATTADAIAAGDMSRRVQHPSEVTEAGRLGVAINSMLERIEEAFRAREASEERVRRFAADASHELRTPLTSIQGYTELWRAGALSSKPKLADAMRRMEQESHRMAALVEDLLVLARLDQGRPLDRGPVRLDLIAHDGVRDALAVEPDRPISITAQPVVVQGDDGRLRQIVANLLSNARVHTPAGTPVRVSVTSTNEGASRTARLEVADDGPGLAPEAAAKVFERFYRADQSRARAAGGSGLGLSIVAAAAEAHGGRATVHSGPGQGTRFVIDLPADESASDSETFHRNGGHGDGEAREPGPINKEFR
ncbi:MAG: two-component system, OmpR family, sensor kinase [Acidimicrobiaceae bacterium]|nr:two-component system, OmpR family, sensor kinase [Acidimicrobiaceae bacterium]